MLTSREMISLEAKSMRFDVREIRSRRPRLRA